MLLAVTGEEQTYVDGNGGSVNMLDKCIYLDDVEDQKGLSNQI